MPTRFCGRTDEFERLLDAWRDVASDGGPRIVVLRGDSGTGKTRLVQEFYRWLAKRHRSEEGASYWPAGLAESNEALLINPLLHEVDAKQNPPFLWWGLRIDDPGRRNAAGTGAAWKALHHLEPHLAPLQRAQRHKRYWLDQAGRFARGALGFIPLVGQSFDLGGHAVDLISREIERQKDRETRTLDEEERAQRHALSDRIANTLGQLMRPRRDTAPIPLIWLLDDAHHSVADPGVTELLDRLLREAFTDAWPLLTVITYHSSPWFEERSGERVPGIARKLHELERVPVIPPVEPVDLHALPSDELGPVLDEELPGLTPDQRQRLLERAGGLPGFLAELIRFCLEEDHLFVDHDSTQALEPEGLDEVLRESTDYHKLVRARLRNAPADVRHALTLASPQGHRLLHAITKQLTAILARNGREDLLTAGESEALERAERPHAFISRRSRVLAEYSYPVYHEVARKDLPNVLRHEALDPAFRQAVREEYATGDTEYDPEERDLLLAITSNTLEDSPDVSDRLAAAQALVSRVQRANERYDPMLAARIAERLTFGIERDAWTWPDLGFSAAETTCRALLNTHRFTEAHTIAQALVDIASSALESATAHEALGDILHATGELHAAGAEWLDARAIRRALTQAEPSDMNERRLAIATDRMARWEFEQGNQAVAAQRFEEVHSIADRLNSLHGTPERERDLSISLVNVADVKRAQGDLKGALERYEHALMIDEGLRTRLGTPESERDVSISLVNIGDIQYAQGNLSEALEHYERALEINEGLHALLGTPDSERGVSVSLGRVADVLRAHGDLQGALERHTRALAIREHLHARLGTPDSSRNISVSLGRIAEILRVQGDLPGALERHTRALAIRERRHARLGTPESERDVSVSLGRIADVLRAQGDLQGALERYERSLEIDLHLFARLGTPESERYASISLGRIADVLREQGDLQGALEYYRGALEIDQRLRTRFGTPESERDVSISVVSIGDIQYAQGDLPRALEYYHRALEINERLHAVLGTPDSEREVSVCLERIGDVLSIRGDVTGALEHYERALGLNERIHARLGTPDSECEVLMSRRRIEDVRAQSSFPGDSEQCELTHDVHWPPKPLRQAGERSRRQHHPRTFRRRPSRAR